MKNTAKLFKRILATAAALGMCLSVLPTTALAAENHPHKDNCELCAKGNHDGWPCDCCGAGDKDKEPEKPETPECNHEYVNGRCTKCKALDPKHVHDYGDDGKCVCGEQKPVHEHSWTYDQYYRDERFTHYKYCSCGEKVKEPCDTEIVVQWGQKVVRCKLCGYWEPVEDVHEWGKWEPDGNGKHTAQCTDPDCNEKRTEECKLVAFNDGLVSGVKCEVCGWVKYDDGTPGDGDEGCPNGEHTYGNVAVYVGDDSHQYKHKFTCLDCGHEEVEACQTVKVTDENGKPVAYVCPICDHYTSLYGTDYCTDGKEHQYYEASEVLSEDETTVFTTQVCKICGFAKVQVCHAPAHVTVKYVYKDENGDEKEIHKPQSQAVIKGTNYEIKSPVIEGYEPDQEVISGTSVDGKDEDYTVTYTKVEKKYTLTINYVDDDTKAPFYPTYKQDFAENEEYKVESPKAPEGYDFAADNDKVVTGCMPGKDLTLEVSYKPVTFTQTIEYVIDGADEPFKTETRYFTIHTLKELGSVESPVEEGYKADKTSVPAPEKLENTVVKVTYTPINYTWTISYVDADGKPMEDMEPYTTTFNVKNIKELEAVASPTKEGYTADTLVVSAPTKLEDTTVKVTYNLSAIYKLVVNHVYVAHDGSLDTETVTLGETFKLGDTYETAAKSKEGYTLTVTPENANGTFGATDVTVTYQYTEDTFTVIWVNGYDGGTVAEKNYGKVTETEDYRVEFPEDPTRDGYTFTGWGAPVTDEDGNITIAAQWRVNSSEPTEPTEPDEPDEPNPPYYPDRPDEEVPEDETPLTDNEDEDIPEDEVPLAPPEEIIDEETPLTEAPEEEIPEEDIPLVDAPKTGSNAFWVWAVTSAAGLALLALAGKRRKSAK